MDGVTLHRFVTDVAQRIHDYDVIARRYGFSGEPDMLAFIKRHEAIRRRIKLHRAIWESDSSLELRIRTYSQQGLIEGLPNTLEILHDKTVTAATRLDALTKHARIAGVDGPGAGSRDQAVGAPSVGGKFSITIQFPGAGQSETFATIEGETPVLPPQDEE
jgi:hypothetical protein